MTEAALPSVTVYLLRHGSTRCNEEGRICGHLDVPLSELGRHQAARAAELLAPPLRLDRALSSPFGRTLETARLACRPHGIEPEVHEGLGELALGSWSGRTRRALGDEEPLWRSWLAAPHETATPDGERLEDVRRRGMDALQRGVSSLPDGGGLLVVSHGGVIRVLLLALLGMPLSGYQKIRADPGSVAALRVGPTLELRLLLGLNLGGDLGALRRRGGAH